nr:uncharacterized protein LOC113710425 isoform X1 [Coffea arabica]XP_027089232.1 uncharacterized protein LOC113710425 isoform X1 [Coffea arabica]
MMTGGKVILTYKRQRTPHWIAYKRKKPPSRKDFSWNNESPDTSARCPSCNGSTTTEKKGESNESNKSECPSYNASTTAKEHEESTQGNNSECPSNDPSIKAEKLEESTDGNIIECPSTDVPTTAQKQEETSEGNRSGCPRNDALTMAETQEESTEGNGSECPSNDAPNTAEKEEESTEDNESEFPRTDSPPTAENQQESTEDNRSECPARNDGFYLLKHASEGKRQYSGYIKRQNFCVSAEKASIEEDKNLLVHDMRQLDADSHAVLEASPREGIFQNASGDQLSADLHTPGKSASIKEASYSVVKSISIRRNRPTMKCSIPSSANCNSGSETHQFSLKSSVEKDYAGGYKIASELDKFNLKETCLPVEDKPGSLSASGTLQSKLSSPLITFYRRCKRKKDVDGLHTQNTLGVAEDCSLEFTGSKSAGFASVGEATPPESGSKHILVNTNPSEENLNRRVAFDANHEKMASREVEESYTSRLSPENANSFEQADDKLENTQDNQSTLEVFPQNSVGVDFLEGRIGCSGNLSNDSADDLSCKPVSKYCKNTVAQESLRLSCQDTVAHESLRLSYDDLSTVRKTNEIPRGQHAAVSLDLSVPLPDSHGTEECGTASIHEEQPLCGLLNSQSGSHTMLIKDESPGSKRLELLCERVGEKHPLHQAQLPEDGFLSEEAVGHNYNNVANSSPVFGLKNNCLQLFPEDRSDDMFQSKKTHKYVTACADSEERTVGLTESRSQTRLSATKSSLFLGLFLPMELINDGHDQSSTSSQRPNIGIQSKEFAQDTVPEFPHQTSSYRRHKMVLDNIVSRARMPKRKRGSCLESYDSPRMWSEEELDSLWVGIRRYGRGNWDVMLRDPRLHFCPWRTPKELAEQWEEEQSKLFNTMPTARGRHSRTPNIFQDSVDSFWHSKTGKENLVDDVQLSLGDVYSQPNDRVQKRPLFNYFNVQTNAPWQLQKAATNTRTMYSCRENRRRAMLQNNAMLDVECSFGANQSTCMAIGGNLPHWLREVVSIPLRSPQTVLPSDNSSVGSVERQWVKKPFLDATGIHHEPSYRISNKRTVAERVEQQAGAGAHNGNFPFVLEHNQAEVQNPGIKQDLIMIDSDTSSEETISDDHNAKV